MTDPDVLDYRIYELKELQRAAWRKLADSSLTLFERREVRNQIRLSNNELRQYLQMMSERVRFRVRSVEEGAGGFRRPNLRLLTLDEPPADGCNGRWTAKINQCDCNAQFAKNRRVAWTGACLDRRDARDHALPFGCIRTRER
jgi:hypothetical protein